MVGWYRADAHEEPKSNSDVAGYTSISESTISRQNKFLTDIGILEKEGQQRKLTDTGLKITKNLAMAQEGPAKREFRTLLENMELTDQLHSIVEMNGPLEEEALLKELASITGFDNEGRHKTGLRSLADLYEWAGYFETSDGHYKAVPLEELEEEESSEKSEHIEKKDKDSRTIVKKASTRSDIEVSISLEVSTDDSDQDIIDTIKAIRQGLKANTGEVSGEDVEEVSQIFSKGPETGDKDQSS